MIKIVHKVYSLFSKKDKRHVLILLSGMIGSAILEMMGVAFIFPFIALLSNPEYINNHLIFIDIKNFLHLSSNHQLMLVVGSMMLLVLVVGNTFSAYIMWRVLRFSNMQEYELSRRLLETYFKRPYSFFVTKNPSEFSKNILSEVCAVTTEVIVPGLQMISKIIAVSVLLCLLIMINIELAITIILSFCVTYMGIYFFLKKKLDAASNKALHSNKMKFRYVYESFNAIKDLKLFGAANYALRQFSKPAEDHAMSRAIGNTIAYLPKYFFEIIAFGSIILFMVIMLSLNKNINGILPVLATYAFAGMRMMPSVQLIYNSASLIRFGSRSLDHLYDDFQLDSTDKNLQDLTHIVEPFNLLSNKKIILNNIFYTYPEKLVPVISSLNLEFELKKSTAIIGVSGAGKTTIADILLGLLVPQAGHLQIDNHIITEKELPSWQMTVGYVPQNIYLIDDTITKNIAFGVSTEKINMQKVKWAAEVAAISGHIENDMAHGYETMVGDKGILLSGGQRQRLGIARALYRNPDILVLDEATSALDSINEKKILDTIYKLQKTVILITHRLSTIETCDKLYILEKNGKISGMGSFLSLKESNSILKNLLNPEEETIE